MLLAPSFNLAQLPGAGAQAAVDQRIAEVGDRLAVSHNEFRDGWTAPTAKPLRERYAAIYAIILIVIGAAVGQFVAILARNITLAAEATANSQSASLPAAHIHKTTR